MTHIRLFCLACGVIALVLLLESASGQRPKPAGARNTPPTLGGRPAGAVPTSVNIHGPMVLSASAIAEMGDKTAAPAVYLAEKHNDLENMIGPGIRPLPVPLGASDSGQIAFPPPPDAPVANPAVVSGSAGVIDPQIAVGGSDVLVTLRHNILLFKKADLIGKPTGASVNAQVIATDKFFSLLTDDINQHLLNQPGGYGVNEGYGINPTDFPGNTYYDARAVYDNYRKRF
jgi:hypothetical protein